MAVYVSMVDKPTTATGCDEWATTKVNISAGCENDCVYCYAKLMGYDQGWAVKGQWHNMVLRQDEVEMGRRRWKGRIALPSAHEPGMDV
jgi:DNA repair photolyase